MESNASYTNFYLMSFITSVILVSLGTLLLLLGNSTWVVLFSIVIFSVGLVQVIADLGWLSIIKINANLPSWRDAYPIVAKQRSQKIFLVPFFFDICFVIISLMLFITIGINM